MLNSVPCTAASISASAKMRAEPLPPSSKTTFLRFDWADVIWIARPVRMFPVKEMGSDFHVEGHGVARDVTVAGEDAYYAWREATLLNPLGDLPGPSDKDQWRAQ